MVLFAFLPLLSAFFEGIGCFAKGVFNLSQENLQYPTYTFPIPPVRRNFGPQEKPSMLKFASFVWTLTAIFFLVSLAFIYANVGEIVNLDGNTRSISEWSLSRANFFYFTLVGFMIINMVLRGLGYLLNRVPVSSPHRKTFMTTGNFKTNLTSWAVSFSAIVNIALIFSVLVIGFANYSKNPISTHIGWFLYLGFGLVAVWFLWLLRIMVARKTA